MSAPQQGNPAGKEDYLDKGLDAAEKKFGQVLTSESVLLSD